MLILLIYLHACCGADYDAEIPCALSAGREQMNEQMQALAFLAGANSISTGRSF